MEPLVYPQYSNRLGKCCALNHSSGILQRVLLSQSHTNSYFYRRSLVTLKMTLIGLALAVQEHATVTSTKFVVYLFLHLIYTLFDAYLT